jgi:hypothetical protein
VRHALHTHVSGEHLAKLHQSYGENFGGATIARKRFLAATAIVLVVISLVAVLWVPSRLAAGNKDSELYIGVSFCGNTTSEAKLLIDRVKGYTNLFVLQSWVVSRNQTAIYEICDYAVSQKLNIIVNLLSSSNQSDWYWQFDVFKTAEQRWGKQFLGAYYNDEPAGLQIDYNWKAFWNQTSKFFSQNASASLLHQMYAKVQDAEVNGTKPQNYDLEAQIFQAYFERDRGFKDLKSIGTKTFVSDYVLHWFDYLGGYDVVLAQFGYNNSYYKDIDFVRGAANLQNKQWGAIITWKYSAPPYLDSGEEIHQQMIAACEAGAKYIIIFDYPQIGDNPYGAMMDEHFEALERFANDVMATAKMRTSSDLSKAQAVLVLPQNYGWGMRREDDVIWGYWGPDQRSPQIWDTFTKLILQYDIHLDIVYDDPNFPVTGKYEHIYFWNQTV